MQPTTARRVVTGFDDDGASIVVSDGPPPNIASPLPGLVFSQIWQTSAMPVPILKPGDPSVDVRGLEPPTLGSVIRIVDFPPARDEMDDPETVRKTFEEIGAAQHTVRTDDAAHPSMHKTSTIDYGIVVWGEITLLLERGEATLHAGDVCVQRGTVHGWQNRGDAPCRIVFVLLDGTFEDGERPAV